MTKVRVQDATRELSEGADKLLGAVSQSRKQAFEALRALKRLSDDMNRQEREQREQAEREALSKQYEEAAQFMTAYSTEQVPQPVDLPQPVAEQSALPVAPVAPVAAADAPPAAQSAPAPQAPPSDMPPRAPQPRPQGPYGRPPQGGQQGPYGRPVQGGQQGPYGRPPQGPDGRPPQGGQQGPYGRPPMGGMNRPAQGGFGQGRPPMGGGAPRPGGPVRSFGGRKGPELTPTVEKERVSNYDPNKKQYQRQNDPERNKSRAIKGRGGYGMDDEFVRGKRKKKSALSFRPEPIKIEKAFMTAETITVKDLTERIGKPAGEIIKKLLLLGIMATINNELDYDTALLVCQEFGIELEMKLTQTAEDVLTNEGFEDKEENLEPRAPAVTIMGHVDHGKTSLLDHIRKTRVTAGEAGGITQHIGAYTVDVRGQRITFLDTPGHEAFTAMRARGAQATDIAVLVVAADDGVMPQTIEAINHAKAADVPIIVAINKVDKPSANVEKIRQELTEYGLVAEDWGGDTIMVPVSAVTGEGVDKLLEMILLVAEMNDLRANPNRKARGIIIEARLDKSRGPVATILIKNGTLNVGDMIVAGTAYGRVRAMMNDRGERMKSAGPSDPVEVIGFGDVPDAGDLMSAVDDDKLSRQVAEERKDKLRAALVKSQTKTTLDDLFGQIQAGQIKDLNLIVKADVQGSVEAVKQSLEKLTNDEVRVRCIHGGVGAINESDVMLASVSGAIIIGFNVRMDNSVRDMAEREKVDIRLYRVIYSAIEEIEAAMKGMLTPKFKEVVLGHAQVRQTFRVTGVGMIAGSYVTDGKIVRNAQARLLRDNVVVHESKVESLKRFKDDAKEVATGYECGIGLENYNDVKENDVIECFQMEEIER
ncbi:MAG: translation initiation factor IF-2 [Christensenellaceae bacterium]|nr:translation initiation factor IF-2 [Christensenellaceae bacterium]